MKKTAIALLALLASGASLAATPWQKITHPVAGSAQSIGAFSNGCIVGAQELPLQSDTYQVMRTDQRRYFGHPDLVLFIQRLGNQVHNLGLGTMLIGDMGMPAGGRFNGGHASHQTGLDVDIFLQLPKARWSSAQLLKPQALDLVSSDGTIWGCLRAGVLTVDTPVTRPDWMSISSCSCLKRAGVQPSC